jgi:dihydropteroate synthase
MINADSIFARWQKHAEALASPVRNVTLPRLGVTFEDRAYQMGVVNFSRDSSYRESVVFSQEQADYRCDRLLLEGATILDLGAESVGDFATRVSPEAQAGLMLPTVRRLAARGVPVSVETYSARLAKEALEAGAAIINLTGRDEADAIYDLCAEHAAGLIICYMAGGNVRDNKPLPSRDALVDEQMRFFQTQLERATRAGVECIWVDPGLGFFNNLPDGPRRVAYQIESALEAFRFRVLGWPICLTLASPVYWFREEARVAETAFALLCMLSKANLLRSHEAARVQPLLAAQDLAPVW